MKPREFWVIPPAEGAHGRVHPILREKKSDDEKPPNVGTNYLRGKPFLVREVIIDANPNQLTFPGLEE